MYSNYIKSGHLYKILTIVLFIAACSGDANRIDISDSNLDLHIARLEYDLFGGPDSEINNEEYSALRKEYGTFFDLFTTNIIAVGRSSDSSTLYYLNHFTSDLQVNEIAAKTIETYPELSLIDNQFTDAFSRYQILFPEKIIPKLYSFISAFSYTIVVDDSLLGIGLDMYLGRDSEYYRMLGIPAYKTTNMNRENIIVDGMKSWLMTEFEIESENSDLLSHMVYHGKLLYALDLIIPDVEDSLKMGYTSKQQRWIEENEKDMFFHFTEKELFYNKDGKQIQKYIGEAPFTPGFPEGSPGMTGRWLGWQIVKKYMAATDPLDVKALFGESDAQKILKISKYKPQ